jgi:hypothetical protein
MYAYYGTLAEATTYFSYRLHEFAWGASTTAERVNALIWATRIIDKLNFKGEKAAVYALCYDSDGELITSVTQAEIRAADASQELEFPRGTDTDVPDAIKLACWEIAYALLDDIDPDAELENLSITSQGVASVRSTYNREQTPIEHLINGVPSATAWRFLRPFLRDSVAMVLKRVN